MRRVYASNTSNATSDTVFGATSSAPLVKNEPKINGGHGGLVRSASGSLSFGATAATPGFGTSTSVKRQLTALDDRNDLASSSGSSSSSGGDGYFAEAAKRRRYETSATLTGDGKQPLLRQSSSLSSLNSGSTGSALSDLVNASSAKTRNVRAWDREGVSNYSIFAQTKTSIPHKNTSGSLPSITGAVARQQPSVNSRQKLATSTALAVAKANFEAQQKQPLASSDPFGYKESKVLNMISPDVDLTAEQKAVVDMVVNQGKSVFLTGSAGTGKSLVLHRIIDGLKRKYHQTDHNYGNGSAASSSSSPYSPNRNVGRRVSNDAQFASKRALDRFLTQNGVRPIENEASNPRGSSRMMNRGPQKVVVTATTGIAAINISGMTLHSFAGIGLGIESADKLIGKVRKFKETFNRWNVCKVLIIDEISMLDGYLFDKLNAIAKVVRGSSAPFGGIQLVLTGDFFQLPPVEKTANETRFCFESAAWAQCISNICMLTQVFRQRDMSFVRILNEMRTGQLSNASQALFQRLCRPRDYSNKDILPTELYPLRNQVDIANRQKLEELHGHPYKFNAMDDAGKSDYKEAVAKLDSNCLAPKELTLKVGAQVMLIKNMPDYGLVNGSRGVVISFTGSGDDIKPVVKFNQSCLSRNKLSSALDNAAQSTPTTSATPNAATAPNATATSGPNPGKDMGLDGGIVITAQTWTLQNERGEISRTQIPLILAWAISIHKSQGQSIDRVVVDLGRIFERGQAYVALSRATSIEGLQVLNYNPSKIMAHPKVIEFYQRLAEDKQQEKEARNS